MSRQKKTDPPETVELKWCPMCGWTLADACAGSDGTPPVSYSRTYPQVKPAPDATKGRVK